MSIDYDLIILGASPAGVQAAIAAANLKARVALVTQQISPRCAPESLAHHAWVELAHQVNHAQSLDALPADALPFWSEAALQVNAIVANVAIPRSTPALAYAGIDVLSGVGEFCRKPAVGVVVDGRLMQARAYLLATGACPVIPEIAGLEAVGYLTSETLERSLNSLPLDRHFVVLGSGSTAVELAQALAHLGATVSLVAHDRALLPAADQEMARFVQAQLEADGVAVWINSVAHVRSVEGKKQLEMNPQLDAQMLTADEIIVAAGHSPNVAALNLEAVKVRWNSTGIWRNQKLQTTNRRIYVCEGRVENECFTQVAQQEAAIALKNALFLPIFRVNYAAVPLAIFTAPSVAWVGLSETQAVQRYGDNVSVLRRSADTVPKAQISNDLTGFCKLIVHRNGRILGAHLVGAAAAELIGIIAFAMQQRVTVENLAKLILPVPTLAELVQQTAASFNHYQLQRNHRRQEWLDRFFDLRRAWTKQ